MLKRIVPVLLAAAMILSLGGCGKRTDSLKDGYYTAQAAEYNNGWKEFVTLCISNGEVVSVEYNAKNASGYIKSWDMAYMRRMNSIVGTYPNQYTRKYAADFLQTGDVNQIDAIAGASTSYKSFIKLLSSALENAKAGNSEVAIVSTDTGGCAENREKTRPCAGFSLYLTGWGHVLWDDFEETVCVEALFLIIRIIPETIGTNTQ